MQRSRAMPSASGKTHGIHSPMSSIVALAGSACLTAPASAEIVCTLTGPAAYGAGNAPNEVAVGDLDGDLDLDLATANQFGSNVSILSKVARARSRRPSIHSKHPRQNTLRGVSGSISASLSMNGRAASVLPACRW